MLTQPLSEIERKAEMLASGLKQLKGLEISIQNDTSQSGGGALPTGIFPTKAVCIRHERLSENKMETALRTNEPHMIARIREGMVVFDPRTLNDEEIGKVVEAVKAIL